MEEKNRRELNMDEMDKVSGGAGDELRDERGTYIICPECGGRASRVQFGGWAEFVCENCNLRILGG